MRVYYCQGCPAEGTTKEKFKLVKIDKIGLVYCLECVEVLQQRMAAENYLRKAHDALEAAGKADWHEAHAEYKAAFQAASDARHALNVREYGL